MRIKLGVVDSYILKDLTLEHAWLILEYGLDSVKEFIDKCFS